MAIGTTPSSSDVEMRTVSAIIAAVGASDLRRAYELANWAIGQGISNRTTHNARGLALQTSGQHWKALDDFRRAATFSPNDPAIFNAIGLSELALMRFDQAVKSFDAAIAVEPNNPLTHYRRGLALGRAGDHDAAKPAYERAVELKPDFALALASLASISARKRQAGEARAYIDRALAINPGELDAHLALIILDMNEEKFAEAEDRLKSLLPSFGPDSDLRPQVLGMLADSMDGQGRYAEAFQIYKTSNDETRLKHSAKYQQARGADAVRHITSYFESAPAEAWRAPDSGALPPGGPREHIFLLGFMRSGTTLLEHVLASNSDVVAYEEKGLLNDLSDTYMTSVEDLDALSRIQGDELEAARQSYWARAASHGGSLKNKIFVDKQPLDTPKLPLIAKIFPSAKILFALRDPRDVVFSCFRRNFRIHTVGFEFLALEDTANFYASVMNLAEIYRRKIPLYILEHRYEDMVTGFETQVRAVCEFIGLEWSDSMRDFDKNAPKVDLRSPSARQVQRPLYSEGIGQWRKYAEQLAPIQPILKPWVEKFGYPAE
jgi:tetratricopeptide (TPR) repeat protein